MKGTVHGRSHKIMIYQSHFYTIFVEILNLLERRTVPDWLFENIMHAIQLSRCSHSSNAKDLAALKDGWDDIFFTNDRYETTSLVGAITELAWILSHTDEELMSMRPFLTRYGQHVLGLDFLLDEQSYQLKTVELRLTNKLLQVRDEYLITTADYLVLIDPVNAKAYTLSPDGWEKIRSIRGDKMFWVVQSDVELAGGEVRDLPKFITRAKP